ncbi:MAG: PQQ-binding-like beta-propeller repeat protein [Mariniblastus sp.]
MNLKKRVGVIVFGILAISLFEPLAAQDESKQGESTQNHPIKHTVLTQGKGNLAIVDGDGKIEWQMKWGGIHDIHVLESGNILTRQGRSKVVEIDRSKKEVVWSYDSATQNGNEGKPVEVHAFQPLANGNVMIAESGPARIIEVDRGGELIRNTKLKVNNPHVHTDTRLVRQLASGNYLVCHEGDGVLREYEPGAEGNVVWEYPIPMFDKESKRGHGPESFGNKLFGAVRLENGNTLIATGNGHSVIEVTPEKEIVWHLKQNELPGIVLAWVTTLEVLPNGNFVIGNCHAGPGQPLLIEVEPKTKQVVWKFDQFETFGNSVSNSQLLDVKNSIR